MRKLLIAVLVCWTVSTNAQTAFHNGPGGEFGLGVRSTTSFFNKTSGIGTGWGGQFRLRFFKYLNSEWFADYIQSDIQDLGKRTDYHIGWAVMFYPPFLYRNNQLHKIQPYFMAGHCFDYTRFESSYAVLYPNSTDAASVSRWSAAITAGLGCSLPMTDRIDLSASALFMNHLGKEIIPEVRTDAANHQNYLYFNTEEGTGLEGHLLVSVSLNIRIADLWKKAIKQRTQSKEMEDQNKPNPF